MLSFERWIDLAVVVGCAVVGKKINDTLHEKDQKHLLALIETERLKLEIENIKKKQEIEKMRLELEYLKEKTS